MENIIGGSFSIVLPHRIHKNYTLSYNEESVCKVTTSIEFEVSLAKYLDSVVGSKGKKHFSYMNVDSLRKLSLNKPFTNFLFSLEDFLKIQKPVIDFYYFTMDYAGKDIFELCNENSPILFKDEKNFKTLVTQLQKGINFLHSKNVCHFDIKPENITFCSYYKHFKYIDFGYAELYPFVQYIEYGPRGTPDFIPLTGNAYFMDNLTKDIKCPYVECNDWVPQNKSVYASNYVFHKKSYPELAYKCDTYSFGKTLYYIYTYLLYVNNNIDNIFKRRTEKLIYDLINCDIIVRPYISNVNLKEYYNINLKNLVDLPEFGSHRFHYNYKEIDNSKKLGDKKTSDTSISIGSSIISDTSDTSDTSVTSDTSDTSVTSVTSDTSNEKDSKIDKDTSDTDSISSVEVQNMSQNCLSNVFNKLSFKKLIFYFLK